MQSQHQLECRPSVKTPNLQTQQTRCKTGIAAFPCVPRYIRQWKGTSVVFNKVGPLVTKNYNFVSTLTIPAKETLLDQEFETILQFRLGNYSKNNKKFKGFNIDAVFQ